MNLSRESLLDDFSTMLSEAEDLLKRAGNETGERAKDLRAQVEAKLLAAKLRLQELEGEAMDRAKRGGARHRRLRARQSVVGDRRCGGCRIPDRHADQPALTRSIAAPSPACGRGQITRSIARSPRRAP